MKVRPALVLTPLLVLACSAHGSGSGFDSDGGTGDLGSSGSSGFGSSGGAGDGATVLYAHTDRTLFQLDPEKLGTPTKIGDFDCINGSPNAKSMTDLAVTRDGKLFGVSEGAAFPLIIQGSTVHCMATWPLPQTRFYGLTVAPANTVAAAEVLIAADGAGGLYQIDQASGTPQQVGTLGSDANGNRWELSGDIVFVENAGAPVGFATVRTCTPGKKGGPPTCSTTDTLIEVDVKAIKPGTQSVLKSVRGPVVRGGWCTNAKSPASFGSMFGIVAYKDKVIGFSRSGDVVQILNTDGSGCLISSDPTLAFAGAGVTTAAPVIAPPPK